MISSRRRFLGGLSAAALAARFDASPIVSAFAPAFAQDYEFKVGYHTCAWGGNTEQAMDEISALGFRGVQIQEEDYRKYASRPAEFKSLMAAKRLSVVSISSGAVTIKPDTEKQEIADRVAMAKWMKDVGGLYLQATDGAHAKTGVNDHDDYKKLSKRLNEIGKRSFGEYGIKLGYHNNMGSLGERPDDMVRIMDATDPKYVWALVDVAHIHAAGGDPVRFTRDYINRLVYPHFQDVLIQKTQVSLDGKGGRPKIDFVELGQGVVNLPGILQIMKDYRYKGWIVIELDRARGGHTPKESAAINKKYFEEKLKLKI